MRASIFGIPIEGPSWPDLRARLQAATTPLWIVTANPEILLAAKEDPEYAKTLQQADLCTVDGIGLWAVLRAQGVRTTRLTGVDLSEHLLTYACEQGLRVAIIGGSDPSIVRDARENLQKRYPTLDLVSEQGGKIGLDGTMDESGEDACMRLTLAEPAILLVAFGHPRQERWIARHLHQFPTVRVAVGIGGTIDFWANHLSRAPQWMQRIGLEWLYRVWQEPRRLRRIVRAVIVFPLRVFFSSSSTSQG